MAYQTSTPLSNQCELIAKLLLSIRGVTVYQEGTLTTIGVVTSYTPVGGNRFMLLSYKAGIYAGETYKSGIIQIRNNGTPIDKLTCVIQTTHGEIAIGNTMLGDGLITYDMYVSFIDGISAIECAFSGAFF
ncbi:MAG: hypothetical protein KGI06_05855 [Candidatus Micrarchaeota archaeon]|nr:hypothetical protein [Candidatus Micrarchaeota archaeon]